jgi:peptide/nickel transport system substrate-binding protein
VDSNEPSPDALVYAFNGTNWYLRWGIWDNLVIQGADNRPQPRLAEVFEMKPDYTGVHIKLRPGLTFHNGRKLTAEDVRFSVDAFRADKINSQLKNPGLMIGEIKISDELTLDMTFKSPRPYMDDYFALLPIVDKDTLDQATQMKVLNGAGPFKFVSYTPNQGYVLEHNPNYWDSGKPYLDRLQGKIYTDDDARTLALQTGELMHTNQVTYAMAKKLKSAKDVTVLDGASAAPGTWVCSWTGRRRATRAYARR